jgi:flagellar motility protein MotE (MotC chaperone)
MRTQSLAAVLGEMDAASAKALTELLAMRRADVNTALTP